MEIVCLDLEGVLVPEIWIAFAEETKIPELKRTTRDEPDYDKLMKYRIGILKEHGLGLKEIQDTIAKIDPIPGAKEFLDELRAMTQAIIISDTFSQFAGPLMKKLGYPTIFCNTLEVADNGEITGFKMRCEKSKYTTVKALQSIGYDTIASGDSHNDLGMIQASKAGFLFKSTDAIKAEYPDIPVQSHLSENTDEMKWVKELHPDCARYWETYDKYGLWKNRTVMAHCVYSDERERAAMKEAGVWAVHCPDSNTCIASGIAPVRTMLKEGVKVAMGSDIAGGAKLSMLDVATEAIRVSKMRWLFGGKQDEERFLTVAEAFYLITGAGQEYFGARPGFGIGDRLHAVVFDDRGMADNPRMNLSERLERIIYLGERQDIKAVYSEGIRRI